MEAVEKQGLIKFEEVSSTLMQAGDILAKNTKLSLSAQSAAQSLLDTAEAEGMSPELDKRMNDWQVKAKEALKKNNERRTPITQLLTRISREFTALENPLDPSKPDSIFSKLQLHRNAYAAAKERERKAKEAEILRKQNVEKERAEIAAEVEKQIRSIYSEKLMQFRSGITKILSSMTPENFAEKAEKIRSIAVDYPRDKFNEITPVVFPKFLDSVEVERIVIASRVKLYDELSANFREIIEADKQAAIDELPSKKKEIERLAKASAEEAEKIRQQQAERERLANEKLKLEQEEAEKQAQAKIEAEKTLNNAQTLFDTAHQIAEINDEAKVKKSYVIEVKDVAGWGAIFMLYFQEIGMSLSVEDFGKKSLNQMKKELEKIANKNGEMLDHPSIRYVEDVKAVVTK
ncbi:hypothetical protein [Sphingobacterium thalpophilum]|uniref:hypothetical protein n=1 Tax=Sphingobacterium thalpophilum TaxID=259 RepID=UPI003D98CA8A